jgi:hypothetical protein
MNILDYIREKMRIWRLHRDPRWAEFIEWTRAYEPPGVYISFSYWTDVLDCGENDMAKDWIRRRSTHKN